MDIPVVSMIIRSGWVARLILIILLFFSIVTWAIIFNRLFVLAAIRKQHRLFRRKHSADSRLMDLETIDRRVSKSPMGRIGGIVFAEYKRILSDAHTHGGVKDWSFFLDNQFTMASERMASGTLADSSNLDKGLFLLAIISSSSPFLGLLGTVWGIMNSFFEIGNQGSASLPVVAPGIAEALITTIIGLVVAIPSLFFYNYFIHQVDKIEDELDGMRETLLLRLKRDIFKILYGGSAMKSPAAP